MTEIEEALKHARLLGDGDLEKGAWAILEGTHWENNFERLLGTLELHGPKFFPTSYPLAESIPVRSIHDYDQWADQFGTILSPGERDDLDAALAGDYQALSRIVQQCPELLYIKELHSHLVELLRATHEPTFTPKERPRNKSEHAHYRKLISDLANPRQGGKRPINEHDVRFAYIALTEHYREYGLGLRGNHTPAEQARKAIAKKLGISVRKVESITGSIFSRERNS